MATTTIASMGTSTCGSMELAASSFTPKYLSSKLQHKEPHWFGFSWNKIRNLNASSRSLRMISNGYSGRGVYRVKKDKDDDKIYRRLDSCLVIPPPKGKKPKAIIKFLGGAFIGAVPEVTYR